MDLAGRLEIVKITHRVSNSAAAGLLQNTPVFVSNGSRHEGRDCLVRFDLRQRRDYCIRNGEYVLNEHNNHPPIGNFITSDVPAAYPGLSKDRYVFTALWENRMEKIGEYPTMIEVNHYFDPGRAGGIPFFTRPQNGALGALLTQYGPSKIGTGLGYKGFIDKKLADPNRASRLVVANDKWVIERLEESIIALNLIPITMEPIR